MDKIKKQGSRGTMHEEKIALVDGQVKAVQQAVAARAVENVYFVACGGSLATLYPGKYILERETAAVSTGAYTAAEFLNDPPARLGDRGGGTAGHRAWRADGGVHHHARFGSGAGGGPYRLLLRRPGVPVPRGADDLSRGIQADLRAAGYMERHGPPAGSERGHAAPATKRARPTAPRRGRSAQNTLGNPSSIPLRRAWTPA